jgi:hypothetical protein
MLETIKVDSGKKLLLFVREETSGIRNFAKKIQEEEKKVKEKNSKIEKDLVEIGDKYLFWGPVDIVHHQIVSVIDGVECDVKGDKYNDKSCCGKNQNDEKSKDCKELIRFLFHVKYFPQLLQSWPFLDQISEIDINRIAVTFPQGQ